MFTFTSGLGLILLGSLKLYLIFGIRREEAYDGGEDMAVGYLMMLIIFMLILTFFIMGMFGFLCEPLTLTATGTLIAGSITGLLMLAAWLSFNSILEALHVPDDSWVCFLVKCSPYGVVLISLSILYWCY